MKVLSLFDGISCGMVALERAGIPVERYVAYEYDEETANKEQYKPYGVAAFVGSNNYPMIEQKGNVFYGDFSEYKGFDLLIGGSPCTYWSIARCPHALGGQRETLSSGLGWELFMQYVRALQEAKPKFFLYENNESMSDEIKEEITKRLGVEPIMIDSADFSAQVRKRYYWTNIPVLLSYTTSPLVFNDICYLDEIPPGMVKSFEKYKNTVRDNGIVISWDTSGKGNYSQQNRARRGNVKMNTLPSSGGDKNNVYLVEGLCFYRNIHPIEAERLQTLPDNYTSCIKSKVKRIELCGNGWTVDVISFFFENLKKLLSERGGV